MAIDTTEKKLSLMDWEEIAASAVPYPDGSLDQGDLQHGLWSYSGINFAPFVPPVPTNGGASAIDGSAIWPSAVKESPMLRSAFNRGPRGWRT